MSRETALVSQIGALMYNLIPDSRDAISPEKITSYKTLDGFLSHVKSKDSRWQSELVGHPRYKVLLEATGKQTYRTKV